MAWAADLAAKRAALSSSVTNSRMSQEGDFPYLLHAENPGARPFHAGLGGLSWPPVVGTPALEKGRKRSTQSAAQNVNAPCSLIFTISTMSLLMLVSMNLFLLIKLHPLSVQGFYHSAH
jgi:hypothetical protein